MNYAIHDAITGVVLRFQSCPEDELQHNLRDGEAALRIEAVPAAGARYGVQGTRLVELPALQQSYDVRRQEAYPSIGSQLDALWHAMDAGMLPKVAAFYDPIAAVKAAIPKPVESHDG